MIRVYTGQWRGLGKKENHNFMQMDFKFREHLKYFRGASLGVFMSLSLHSDENGDSFPSYSKIEEETGYGRDTIATALTYLCDLRIDEHRVLIRYRERDASGKYVGSNKYKIFPTEEETVGIEGGSRILPTLEKTNSGKCLLEVEPVVKEEPVVKKKDPSSTIYEAQPVPESPAAKQQPSQTAFQTPNRNSQQQGLAELMKEVKGFGVSPATFREMTNVVLDLNGKRLLADTTRGEPALKEAQEIAATCLSLGLATLEEFQALALAWKINSWIAQKEQEKGIRSVLTNKQIIETATKVKSGVWSATPAKPAFKPERFQYHGLWVETINEEGDFIDPDAPHITNSRGGGMKYFDMELFNKNFEKDKR